MSKREIDVKRDSGGEAEIGTSKDGAIVEMFQIDDYMIIVKEKALYKLNLADNIDPKRENPNLPQTIQQKILNIGSDSYLTSKTLLTARGLLKSEVLAEHINANSILRLFLEALQEIEMMNSEIVDYLKLENKIIEDFYAQESRNSLTIPSLNNVKSRCKTIFQKADHVMQIMMEIISMFYPNDVKKRTKMSALLEFVESKYGSEDPFTSFIKAFVGDLKLVRAIRNGLDHRLEPVAVKDFEIQSSSKIFEPSIEMNKYQECKLKKTSLNSFLPMNLQMIVSFCEELIAHLSNKNTKSNNTMGFQVNIIPKEKRRNKHIQYAFWSPLGKGGFFHF